MLLVRAPARLVMNPLPCLFVERFVLRRRAEPVGSEEFDRKPAFQSEVRAGNRFTAKDPLDVIRESVPSHGREETVRGDHKV